MTEAVDKTPRVRSPAYPSMGLPEAIEKAKILYAKEGQGRHPIPAIALAKDIGFTSMNGSALTAISAIKQFGLLQEEEVEDGKPRQLRLTLLALELAVRKDDSQEWKEAIQKAALQPRLYERLWKKYGWPLPSDDTIQTYLQLEEQYNAKFIVGIIRDYKATIALAKLIPLDKIGGTEQRENGSLPTEEEENMEIPAVSQIQQKKDAAPPPPAAGQKDFPLYLSNNKRAILYIPASMTAKDYELLKKQIENHLAVIEATSVSGEAEN
jgi:hypothetical protein